MIQLRISPASVVHGFKRLGITGGFKLRVALNDWKPSVWQAVFDGDEAEASRVAKRSHGASYCRGFWHGFYYPQRPIRAYAGTLFRTGYADGLAARVAMMNPRPEDCGRPHPQPFCLCRKCAAARPKKRKTK